MDDWEALKTDYLQAHRFATQLEPRVGARAV